MIKRDTRVVRCCEKYRRDSAGCFFMWHEIGDFAEKQEGPEHRPVGADPGESVTDEGVLLF